MTCIWFIVFGWAVRGKGWGGWGFTDCYWNSIQMIISLFHIQFAQHSFNDIYRVRYSIFYVASVTFMVIIHENVLGFHCCLKLAIVDLKYLDASWS